MKRGNDAILREKLDLFESIPGAKIKKKDGSLKV